MQVSALAAVVDEHLGDVLRVADLVVALPDLEQRVVAEALRVGRVEAHAVAKRAPPAGRLLPQLALDVVDDGAAGPAQQRRDDVPGTLAGAAGAGDQVVLRAVVGEQRAADPAADHAILGEQASTSCAPLVHPLLPPDLLRHGFLIEAQHHRQQAAQHRAAEGHGEAGGVGRWGLVALDGERLHLPGVVEFEVKQRPSRWSRDPLDGAAVGELVGHPRRPADEAGGGQEQDGQGDQEAAQRLHFRLLQLGPVAATAASNGGTRVLLLMRFRQRLGLHRPLLRRRRSGESGQRFPPNRP